MYQNKTESEPVFQAKTQAKFFYIESGPRIVGLGGLPTVWLVRPFHPVLNCSRSPHNPSPQAVGRGDGPSFIWVFYGFWPGVLDTPPCIGDPEEAQSDDGVLGKNHAGASWSWVYKTDDCRYQTNIRH